MFFSCLATGIVWVVFRVLIAEYYANREAGLWGRKEPPRRMEKVLIVGAGHAGLLILQELERHPELGYEVVGLVDDAPEKASVIIHGKTVLGSSRTCPPFWMPIPSRW